MLGSTKYLSTATIVVGAYWITVRRNGTLRYPKIHRITKSPRNSIDKLLVASESNCKVKRLRIDEYMPGGIKHAWAYTPTHALGWTANPCFKAPASGCAWGPQPRVSLSHSSCANEFEGQDFQNRFLKNSGRLGQIWDLKEF